MSRSKKYRFQRRYQGLKKQYKKELLERQKNNIEASNVLQLPNKNADPISSGQVYKVIFQPPKNVTIKIPNTNREYTIKEVSLHFLNPNSAINSHSHKNDTEIYFEPNLDTNSWRSLGLCTNGENHFAERHESDNENEENKNTSINGIRAGVKLSQVVENSEDREIIEQYLINNILPFVGYNSEIKMYGFKTKEQNPEVCLAQVVDNGIFESFAISADPNSIHIVKPESSKVRKLRKLKGPECPYNGLEAFDSYFNSNDPCEREVV